MGSVDRRLSREFDTYVDSIMDRSSKEMAYAADPDWKRAAYAKWRFEREAECPPEPSPALTGYALELEMRGIIEFCQSFLEGFEFDPDQVGVNEALERIRNLPPL